MDGKLVSSWYNLHSSVPPSYVQPPERRPGNAVIATGINIPVIDIGGHDRAGIIRDVMKASEEFGFFQPLSKSSSNHRPIFHAPPPPLLKPYLSTRSSALQPSSGFEGGSRGSSFTIPAPSEPGKIELYSPALYAACTVGGIISCGLTHMTVTPLDLVKCNMQVINHGVAEELVEDTLRIFKEFHAMPVNEKISESSKDPNGSCKLYTSSGRNIQDVALYWKDSLQHPCPPSGEFMEYWPEKPAGYREIVGKYTQELRKLGLKILDLLAEGLGLDPKYFNGELSKNAVVISHHYPPCPEPSLTLGASKHKDPNILTILLQQADITALQVFKDGAWIPVEPIPNAFVVNMGFMLQIISNGRLIGAEHRVITNSSTARHTIAYFINPTKEAFIEPAKPLLSSTSPPLFRSMTFGEMLGNFLNKGPYFEPEILLKEPSKKL